MYYRGQFLQADLSGNSFPPPMGGAMDIGLHAQVDVEEGRESERDSESAETVSAFTCLCKVNPHLLFVFCLLPPHYFAVVFKVLVGQERHHLILPFIYS